MRLDENNAKTKIKYLRQTNVYADHEEPSMQDVTMEDGNNGKNTYKNMQWIHTKGLEKLGTCAE